MITVSSADRRWPNRPAREALPVGELSDADLAPIERAEVATQHRRLDEEPAWRATGYQWLTLYQ